MSALEQIILSWFLNAAWELPVCFFYCWLFLRLVPNLAAGIRHRLWLAALSLGFLAPFGVFLGLWGDSKTMSSGLAIGVPARLNGPGGMRLLLLAFLAPALYRAFLLLHGGVAAKRLRRRAIRVDPGILESILPKNLLLSMKQHRAQVFSTGPSTSAWGPFTCGVRHPFILIPAAFFLPPSRQMLVSVVAHELAHVQRGDMLLHLLSEFMLVPLAFHPFSYWLRSQLAETREMACDARVIGQILPATDYAHCLLDVAAALRDSASPLPALGISEGATLESRIRALISLSSLRSRGLGAWDKCCLILGASTLFALLFSSGRRTFLWMSAVPEPRIQKLRVPPPPPPPPPPNRR
jgi:Zn-dependent protease with chaperone function